MAKATYKDAGVDLDSYQDAMHRLPRHLRRTQSPRVIAAEGGFAGLFALDFEGSLFARNYRDPVLVSGTDGVGTKLKVAQLCGRHDTVGIDLVAMCVNDALCTGCEMLFFLDYVAMDRDDPERLEAIVAGISEGCVACDAALIGGETAIMPDLYAPGEYDLAGFCVGVVERRRLITGSAIAPSDVVIGIASAGLHSNGYSLVRKIVFEIAGLGVESPIEGAAGCAATVADELLRPTQIYVRQVRAILTRYRKKQVVHGMAHITGGGLLENLARILPAGCGVEIDSGSWPIPPVFAWLQQLGNVDDEEMGRVFNMGIGFALVVNEYFADSIGRQLADQGLDSWVIGRVRKAEN